MNGESSVPPAANQPESPWQYKTEGNTAPTPPTPAVPPGDNLSPSPVPFAPMASVSSGPAEVTWTASEFIDHQKNISWYALLALLTVAVDAIVYLWTRDIVSIVALTTMAVLLGVVASRKPRVMEYHLDAAGLTIGQTFHPYSKFKSFSVVTEGAFSTVTFSPLKRFMPPVGIYFGPDDEERVMAVLSQHLPYEDRKSDAIDKLSRRVRF